MSDYLYPIEILSCSVGTFLGPILLLVFYGEMHLLTFYVWLAIRLIMNFEIHLGYQFP